MLSLAAVSDENETPADRPPRARLARRERAVAATLSLALSLAFWGTALVDIDATGFGDWQMIHHNWEAGYAALTRDGTLGLWDPYHCGGITLVGNPEAQHLSPGFSLAPLFGPTLGVKLLMVLHTFVALFGFYVYARRIERFAPAGAAFGAVAFGAGGFFVAHLSGGHATFAPFCFAPALLYAFERSMGDLRWTAGVAGWMVLTLLEGGTYPFPYFVLLLAFAALRAMVRRRDAVTPLAALGVASALTSLAGAVRVLPIWNTLQRFPRDMPGDDRIGALEVLEFLTRGEFPWRHPDHPYVWPEYTLFIGYGAFAMSALGLMLVLARPRAARRLGLVAGALVFFAFTMGHHGPWSPWGLVHELPIFRGLRVPSRFGVLLTLYVALLAGVGFDGLGALLRRRLGPRVTAGIMGLLLIGAFVRPAILQAPWLDRWHGAPIVREPVDEYFQRSARGYGALYASLPARNLGSVGCYVGNMPWPISRRLRTGPRPQVSGPGEIAAIDFAGARIAFTASLPAEGTLAVNQNFDPHWTSDVGEVVDEGGRLGLRLPAGEHRVEMRYAPTYWPWALALSGLGAALMLVVAWRGRWPAGLGRSLSERDVPGLVHPAAAEVRDDEPGE